MNDEFSLAGLASQALENFRKSELPPHSQIKPKPREKEKNGQFFVPVVGCYVNTRGERRDLDSLEADHPLWGELYGTRRFRRIKDRLHKEFEAKYAREDREKRQIEQERRKLLAQPKPKPKPKPKKKATILYRDRPSRPSQANVPLSEQAFEMPALEKDPDTSPKVKKEIISGSSPAPPPPPPTHKPKKELPEEAFNEENVINYLTKLDAQIEDLVENKLDNIDDSPESVTKFVKNYVIPIFRQFEKSLVGRRDDFYIQVLQRALDRGDDSTESVLKIKLKNRITGVSRSVRARKNIEDVDTVQEVLENIQTDVFPVMLAHLIGELVLEDESSKELRSLYQEKLLVDAVKNHKGLRGLDFNITDKSIVLMQGWLKKALLPVPKSKKPEKPKPASSKSQSGSVQKRDANRSTMEKKQSQPLTALFQKSKPTIPKVIQSFPRFPRQPPRKKVVIPPNRQKKVSREPPKPKSKQRRNVQFSDEDSSSDEETDPPGEGMPGFTKKRPSIPRQRAPKKKRPINSQHEGPPVKKTRPNPPTQQPKPNPPKKKRLNPPPQKSIPKPSAKAKPNLPEKKTMPDPPETSSPKPFKQDSEEAEPKSSQYMCVSWCKKKKQWKATFREKKIPYFCGYHASDLEAAKAINRKCKEIGIPPRNDLELQSSPQPPGAYNIKEVSPVAISSNMPKEKETKKKDLVEANLPDASNDQSCADTSPEEPPLEVKADKRETTCKKQKTRGGKGSDRPQSKYTCVMWSNTAMKWKCTIQHKGKRHRCGRFDDDVEAAKAVNAMCKKLGIPPKNPDVIEKEPEHTTELESSEPSYKTNFKCVWWDKKKEMWRARFQHEGRYVNIGHFSDATEAAKAVNVKCKELGITPKNEIPEASTKLEHENEDDPMSYESGFKCVFWDQSHKQWKARFTHQREKVEVGHYPSPLEAAKAINAKCEEIGIPLKNVIEETTTEAKAKSDNKSHELVSKYKNVYWDKQNSKWFAQLKLNKKQHTGKRLKKEIDAALAVNEICKKLDIPLRNPELVPQKRPHPPKDEPPRKKLKATRGKSKYRWVCWYGKTSQWKAYGYEKKKQKFIGYYDEEIDAARAVNEYCRKNGIEIRNPQVDNESSDKTAPTKPKPVAPKKRRRPETPQDPKPRKRIKPNKTKNKYDDVFQNADGKWQVEIPESVLKHYIYEIIPPDKIQTVFDHEIWAAFARDNFVYLASQHKDNMKRPLYFPDYFEDKFQTGTEVQVYSQSQGSKLWTNGFVVDVKERCTDVRYEIELGACDRANLKVQISHLRRPLYKSLSDISKYGWLCKASRLSEPKDMHKKAYINTICAIQPSQSGNPKEAIISVFGMKKECRTKIKLDRRKYVLHPLVMSGQSMYDGKQKHMVNYVKRDTTQGTLQVHLSTKDVIPYRQICPPLYSKTATCQFCEPSKLNGKACGKCQKQ